MSEEKVNPISYFFLEEENLYVISYRGPGGSIYRWDSYNIPIRTELGAQTIQSAWEHKTEEEIIEDYHWQFERIPYGCSDWLKYDMETTLMDDEELARYGRF